MSDRKIISINEAREKQQAKKRPSRAKIWLFAAIIFAMLVVLALIFLDEELNLDKVRRFFTYFTASDQAGYGEFNFDANHSNAYAAFDGGLAVAAQSGLCTYAANGTEVAFSQTSMSAPAIAASDSFAMAYDIGGDSILAVDRVGKTCLDLKAEGTIFDLDLAKSGYFCYAMSGEGYKTVLVVYNADRQEIYRWNSATDYLNCCAISKNGRYVAAISVGQMDTAFSSTALVLRTDETEPYAQIPLGSQAIYDLAFLDNGNLCAIGESAVQVMDVDGTLVGEYSYDNAQLADFSIDSDGIALYLSDLQGDRLAVLDEDGQCLQSKTPDKAPVSISLCGKYLAVLMPNEITIYNRDFEVYWHSTNIITASQALMRKDGTVILAGGSRATLYLPD